MNRPIKNLLPLPEKRTEDEDEEMRENDAIAKQKGKIYSDRKRHARDSEIEVGDSVLVRNLKPGKLEPNFMSTPFKVMEKVDGDMIVQNENGSNYRRHSSHLKRFPISTEDAQEPATENLDEQLQPPATNATVPKYTDNLSKSKAVINQEKKSYPSRIRNPPDRLLAKIN